MSRAETTVVVTGIGAATPAGDTVEAAWEAIAAGQSGIRGGLPATLPPGIGRVAAMCAGADRPALLRNAKHAKYAGRAVTLALQALAEAVVGPVGALDPFRIALHGATGQTGLDVEGFFPALSAAWADDPACDFASLGGRPARLVDPHFALRTLANGGLALIAGEVGARGPSCNYVQGETASALAIGAALRDLREDRADVAVVFACDSLLYPSTWLAFDREGLLSRSEPAPALRPFDAGRDGLVLGEAAAVVVLETWRHAVDRGAPALAVVDNVYVGRTSSGVGETSAAGLGSALDQARLHGDWAHLADAGRREPSLLVVARGLGTPVHDAQEAAVLASAGLGAAIVGAFKGATGYLGAATGLVELTLAVRSLQKGVALPIVHLRRPDPDVDLPFAREPRRLAPQARALLCAGGWSGEWTLTAVRGPSAGWGPSRGCA